MATLSAVCLVSGSSPTAGASESRPSGNGAHTASTGGVHSIAHATSRALRACEADGAIITTAMAAFKAEKPGVLVTSGRLLGTTDGGPYLQSWPDAVPFFAFKIGHFGRLEVAIPANAKSVLFTGPKSCAKLKHVTAADIRNVQACEADGATVSVAMAAFGAQNHGKIPTQSLLVSKQNGGPYLQSWVHNAPHYAFRITSTGVLQISIPANTKWFPYTGPNSCANLT